MSQVINGRIYHGAMYGDGSPVESPDATVTIVPTNPNLILSYEVSKVDGQWECDIQIHNHASQDDTIEAFKIVEESAAKHSAPQPPQASETISTGS